MSYYVGKPDNLRTTGPLIQVRLCLLKQTAEELQRANKPVAPPIDVLAMIDTSNEWTVIQEGLATSLRLQPVRVADIRTAKHTYYDCPCYRLCVQFPDNRLFEVFVAEVPMLFHPVKCLIGRDILSRGNLAYDGANNTFSLSF